MLRSAAPRIGSLRQRALVATADVLLSPLGWVPRRQPPVRRILLLRLERIGDLLMALDAIALVRAGWPEARIDLAVGSWNGSLGRLIPGITTVHELDVPWLSRGERPTSWPAIVRDARRWRAEGYDMVINFEPDIRSHLLAWQSGAPIRAGFPDGGGRSILTIETPYDTTAHVAENACRLVAATLRATTGGARAIDEARHTRARLRPPASAFAAADSRLEGRDGPLIGVHVSGGRESKQWHLDRFADAARRVHAITGGTIVLTGSAGDRAMTNQVAAALADLSIVSLAGDLDLPATAAALSRLDVLITGDTGPMHLAAAMDVPIVALFGPSDPARYGPRASRERILRVQLPCSPCGQVRLPPARCRGHVPDCMDGITVAAVVQAAVSLLDRQRPEAVVPAS